MWRQKMNWKMLIAVIEYEYTLMKVYVIIINFCVLITKLVDWQVLTFVLGMKLVNDGKNGIWNFTGENSNAFRNASPLEIHYWNLNKMGEDFID